MKNREIDFVKFSALSLITGAAGALIGFGWGGTAMTACFGGGLGLLGPLLLFLVLCFIDSL